MKRKRKSPTNTVQKANIDDDIQQMDPFTTCLPKSVIQDVLLKLSTRSILICKCVCKTWHDLLSDPEFAELYFEQAEAYPMVRLWHPTHVSRTLYLVEPEDISVFDLKDCECNNRKLKCSQCHVQMNLGKFKIPLRNGEKLTDINLVASRNPGTARKNCIKILQNDHKYNVVNSCIGFLCLSEPIFNDPLVVCNPVTGEFTLLPKASDHSNDEEGSIACGLGFSLRTSKYKVIRIFEQGEPPTRVAELHTLGTGFWEYVDSAPFSSASFSTYKADFTIYMTGVLYLPHRFF